jgi:hypothetical protein
MLASRRTTCWQLTGPLLATLLGACAFNPKGLPSELHDGFDTYSAGKLRHAASLRGAAGSLASAVPQVAASRIAQLAPGLLLFFANDEGKLNELERRLVECAQLAENQVNREYFGGRPPTRKECNEEVGVDKCGKPVKRRQLLGRLKHELARECARKVLDELWPGPYSLEQRYRYWPSSQLVETISPEQEKLLEAMKELYKLRGTIQPDIVLHASRSGEDLLRSMLTLDFKFPCPASNEPRWEDYAGRDDCIANNQKEAYEKTLGGKALIISPTRIWE